MNRRPWLAGGAAAAAAAAAGVLVMSLFGNAVVIATPGQAQDLRAALAANGTMFEPADVATFRAGLAASRAPEDAGRAAVAGYGQKAPPIVYAGRLTVDGHEPAIVNHPVYAVQLTGLTLPPFGGPATDKNIHTELIVFVDATTGDVMLAETVR